MPGVTEGISGRTRFLAYGLMKVTFFFLNHSAVTLFGCYSGVISIYQVVIWGLGDSVQEPRDGFSAQQEFHDQGAAKTGSALESA